MQNHIDMTDGRHKRTAPEDRAKQCICGEIAVFISNTLTHRFDDAYLQGESTDGQRHFENLVMAWWAYLILEPSISR